MEGHELEGDSLTGNQIGWMVFLDLPARSLWGALPMAVASRFRKSRQLVRDLRQKLETQAEAAGWGLGQEARAP